METGLESKDIILTNRELEIIRFLALGNNDNQIASLLFISPLTVKTHRKNNMRKFKAKKCVEGTIFNIPIRNMPDGVYIVESDDGQTLLREQLIVKH